MTVQFTPSAGDKIDDQITLANDLLRNRVVTEVVVQTNEGLRYMRHHMTTQEIRKFIFPEYRKN